tara:strand:+ start:494 stop:919 length:426 start_codon:yes stop_codon:yes gene_type:complete
MPTKATARKSTSTTPRKRRTRKSTAKVNQTIKEVQAVLDAPTPKSLDKVSSTTKVVSLNKSQPLPVIVTEETKVDEKVNTPQLNRPEKPILTVDDYVADFKVRWQIHSYETTILWNQSRNLYTQTAQYVRDSYNKAFNQGE